ncbi:heme peroxidase [Trichodelitschia bisporula]|uniref:Peroxidase n=1 Tax=Trichodelitschia bisporula TaxID=703511 RepID=A0A6G1HLW7_9PEZI|nr:heme peroxidase [Trichodelitschia bisporula]
MKTTTLLFAALFSGPTFAAPGSEWKERLATEVERRAARPANGPDDSSELLGDLVTPGPTTPIGKTIADILVGKADGQSSESYPLGGLMLPPLGSAPCKADTCCVWHYIANDMAVRFRGISGRCNKYARGAVRLGFHDAGAWKKGLDFGGADGSILLSDELSRSDNNGLQEIAQVTQQWYAKYKQYGVSMADIIQMGSTVATVVCPLGPRVRSFVGRKDSSKPAQTGLLPDVNAPADSLIALFEDKTIKPHGLAALVGAHTTSQQRFVDPKRALDPQDSTPGVWDVLFYGQTLNANAPKRVFKFASDVKLSTHPRIASEWKEFAGQGGQDHWNDDYAKEYVRLSLLGVNNINNLTECTKALPGRLPSFSPPDKAIVDMWANGQFPQLGPLLADAQTVTQDVLNAMGIKPRLMRFLNRN